ncbi:MAG: hypothetical protein IJY70_02500 [Clostridia bacterium]|nr:hypothetical protein [Clostridia bacterium]
MKSLEKFFDILGEILAILLVVVYILSLANAQWGFLNGIPWLVNIMAILRTYGSLLLVAVVGLEAMSKRNFIFRIIFYAAIAIIVIFMFFPATYTQLIGLIA